jgi:hypothetical protein
MLHKLDVYVLAWPDWIKMLLLVALVSLSMTAAALAIDFVFENIGKAVALMKII